MAMRATAMREITGRLVLPRDAAPGRAHRVLVELRDVSQQDAPSQVVASSEQRDVEIGPGTALAFRLRAPEGDPRRSLALRAQVDVGAAPARRGAPASAERHYLTTQSFPVSATGAVDAMAVTLSAV